MRDAVNKLGMQAGELLEKAVEAQIVAKELADSILDARQDTQMAIEAQRARIDELKKVLEQSRKLCELIENNTDFEVKNYYILVEQAIKDKCNIIIAPDGIIGNIIFRTLVLLDDWPSNGAITFGINSIYIDTSRDQNTTGYLRSLKLAYKLANI